MSEREEGQTHGNSGRDEVRDRYWYIREALKHLPEEFTSDDLFTQCEALGYALERDSLRKSVNGLTVNNERRLDQPQIVRLGQRDTPDSWWDLLWRLGRQRFRRFVWGKDPFWPIIEANGELTVKLPNEVLNTSGSLPIYEPSRPSKEGETADQATTGADEKTSPPTKEAKRVAATLGCGTHSRIRPLRRQAADAPLLAQPSATAGGTIIEGITQFLRHSPACINAELRPCGLVPTPFHTQYGTVECLAEGPDGDVVLICPVLSLDEAVLISAIRLLHAVRTIAVPDRPARGILVLCGPRDGKDVSWLPDFAVYHWELVLHHVGPHVPGH